MFIIQIKIIKGSKGIIRSDDITNKILIIIYKIISKII